MTDSSRTILVIEDFEPDYLVLRDGLSRICRHQVRWEPNPMAAVTALHDPHGELPDLVVIDMHMPQASGLDVLARLRAAPRTRRLPVVVVSASRLPGEASRARTLGVLAFLSKPVDLDALCRLLDG